MPVVGGKFGVVNGVDTVRTWSISHTAALNVVGASNLFGGTARTRGPNSWSGSYGKYGALPVHWPGDFFTFDGYTAPNTGVFGETGYTYSGTAYVESVVITWDYTTGVAISHVVNFSGHMVLTKANAIHLDDTEPDLPEVHGTKIQFGTDVVATPTDLANWTTATLTINMPSTGYTNSSTYDIATTELWTGRSRTGRFDWNFSVAVQDNNGAILPAVNSRLGWRIWTNATEYYHLLWGKTREHSGITVDTEAGAIIGATIGADMDGYKPGSTSPNANGIGTVIAPDGTVLWPIPVAP